MLKGDFAPRLKDNIQGQGIEMEREREKNRERMGERERERDARQEKWCGRQYKATLYSRVSVCDYR